MIEIVSSLQKEGEDLCSRIDDSIFSAIVEAILQTDYCIENERGLFLLAVRMFSHIQGIVANSRPRTHCVATEKEQPTERAF